MRTIIVPQPRRDWAIDAPNKEMAEELYRMAVEDDGIGEPQSRVMVRPKGAFPAKMG